jgi:hypothetical protein
LLVFTLSLDEVNFIAFELCLHASNNHTSQLFLKTFLLDCEVDKNDLCSDFWLVSRIRQLGCHEKFEVLVVSDILVAQVDHVPVSYLLDSFVEERLQRRINLFVQVLKQDDVAICYRHFDSFHVIFSLRVQYDKLVFKLLFHVSDPAISLHLRVNHKREHSALAHQNTILFAELVVRKTLETPLDKINWFY